MNNYIKDSGDRTSFATGAVRDMHEGKGRCDLMPLDIVYHLTDECIFHFLENFKKTGDSTNLYLAIKEFASVGEYSDNIYNILLDVAVHFENGAKKYGEYNWQKGIPLHSYIDSATRHFMKYKAGWDDERHDRAFIWNLMCALWTIENIPESNEYTINNK